MKKIVDKNDMHQMEELSFNDILDARKIVLKHIVNTPIVRSKSLSEKIGQQVYLKLENQQITGSFKVRGALNALSNLSIDEKKAGVVALSTGNHGRGLAFASKLMKIKCIICMSQFVPKNKIEGIKALGAEVRLSGVDQDEAQLEADRLCKEEGMTYISPFDNLRVIAGQGTLGLEIHEKLPKLRYAIIPLSGGGLISGVAKALKSLNRNLRIIGVSMDRGPAMYESLKAGKPIFVEELKSLADALTGGIGLDNKYTFNLTKELVDDIILVSEKEIEEAVAHVYWKESQIVEGAGAVAVASLLSKKFRTTGSSIALMCGGNIDIDLHYKLISSKS